MNEWIGKPAQALLAAKEEDRFTAYLAELLKADKLLDPFLNELCGVSADVHARSRAKIANQVVVTNGRPDLIITLPHC
ncbi:MAG: hypothetical protein ACREJC_13610, partial [Tepidisphaeraceae bacterium]